MTITSLLKKVGIIISVVILPMGINYVTNIVPFSYIWNNGWLIIATLEFIILVIVIMDISKSSSKTQISEDDIKNI